MGDVCIGVPQPIEHGLEELGTVYGQKRIEIQAVDAEIRGYALVSARLGRRVDPCTAAPSSDPVNLSNATESGCDGNLPETIDCLRKAVGCERDGQVRTGCLAASPASSETGLGEHDVALEIGWRARSGPESDVRIARQDRRRARKPTVLRPEIEYGADLPQKAAPKKDAAAAERSSRIGIPLSRP